MKALFDLFGRDQLSQLFFSRNEEPNYELCSHFYQYTDIDMIKERFFFHRKKITTSGLQASNTLTNTLTRRAGFLFNLLKYIFKSFPLIRQLFWIGSEKNLGILNWSKDIAPDAIFLYCGNLTFVYDFAIYLSIELGIPIFPFFSDDYAFSPKRNLFTELQKIFIKKRIYKVLDRAPIAFCIGTEMCDFYESRFNKKFYPIMNAVDVPLSIPVPCKIEKDHTIKIRFIGGLTIGRDSSILQFAKLLNSININRKVLIEVYTTSVLSNKIKSLYAKTGILLKKPVFGREYEIVRSEADILLHVESYKRKYYSLSQYSISTKIPEYLISGKLVLCYAPSNIASFKLIKENNIGFAIDNIDTLYEQKQALKYLILNYETLSQISVNAFDFASKNYDRKNNATIIRDYITKYS